MAHKKKYTSLTEVIFETSATGTKVKGYVLQVIHKRSGRSYAVVEYRTSLAGGRKSTPLRECFVIVNGCYQGIITRRNIANQEKRDL